MFLAWDLFDLVFVTFPKVTTFLYIEGSVLAHLLLAELEQEETQERVLFLVVHHMGGVLLCLICSSKFVVVVVSGSKLESSILKCKPTEVHIFMNKLIGRLLSTVRVNHSSFGSDLLDMDIRIHGCEQVL